MSDFSLQSIDQSQNSDTVGDENFEDDDLVAFQHDSKTINLYLSQIIKYSKHVRETYILSDIISSFHQEIHKFQEEYQLFPDNIDLFFQLSQQNYNINDDLILTYIQCTDLLKISNFLEVRKLTSKINQYIKSQKVNVDFIIQMIEYDVKTQTKTNNCKIKISAEMENLLTSKINECFSNEKFKGLPIEIIYRIVEQSSPDSINNNKLYDIIIKSLSKFYVLFQFLDLQKLSDDRLEELCDMYSKLNEKTQHYFDYLKCNLNLIYEINNHKKNLQKMNDQQQNKVKDLEEKITSLQNQFNYSKNMNEEFKNQISQLQKQLDEIFLIKGKIVASVENGLFINAEINLKEKGSTLDTTKSKVIISTSDAKYLGSEAYEKGEPITSLHMKIAFACRIGQYYVRCIVFNSEGESNEIVSNSVTTSASCLTFDYEGKPANVFLPKGQYKLEVWGAKGGDSKGEGLYPPRANQSTVQGGLGGYSRGILKLNKDETVYVFVGEEGHPSNSSDGSTTKGSFPDGGGTKTGHFCNTVTVPGTGGGSTSIRIGSGTDYARVIVAGGGGGASGSCEWTNRGGFGGGASGGNSYCSNKQGDSGSGTQKGSSPGLGNGPKGDQGSFGKGAEGKYKSECDSGGGGGGGWYGGGSGGYGEAVDSGGGGGGSGWTFTESSFNEWKNGDSNNSSKYVLSSAYYLTDAVSLSGDEEIPRCDGNGTEHGHAGNGYARITPL